MGTPHVHAEFIKAWADGSEIQYKESDGTWRVTQVPGWYPASTYRVKPETIRYRVALMGVFTVVTNREDQVANIEKNLCFVRWLTDWVEVEV